MQTTQKPVVRYDMQLLAEDMAVRAWMPNDLARAAGVDNATIWHFLRGSRRTPKTLGKIAKALGYKPARYVIRTKGRAA